VSARALARTGPREGELAGGTGERLWRARSSSSSLRLRLAFSGLNAHGNQPTRGLGCSPAAHPMHDNAPRKIREEQQRKERWRPGLRCCGLRHPWFSRDGCGSKCSPPLAKYAFGPGVTALPRVGRIPQVTSFLDYSTRLLGFPNEASAVRTSQHGDSDDERYLSGAREQLTLQAGRHSLDGVGQCGGSGRRGRTQARWLRRPTSVRRSEEGHTPGARRRSELGAGQSEPARARPPAVETGGFFPTEISPFPCALELGKTSFLPWETVSCFLLLFPHLLICQVSICT
jgi:hypothetical protein